jgi:hypothetical protein
MIIQPPKAGATSLATVLLASSGNGSFAAPVSRTITNFLGGVFVGNRLVVIDANNDGKADLLNVIPATSSTALKVAFSITDGTSQTAAQVQSLEGSTGVVSSDSYFVGDVNGDGTPDLLGFSKPTSSVILPYMEAFGDGSVKFVDGSVHFGTPTTMNLVPPTGSTFSGNAEPLVADVNLDGRDDVAIVNHDAVSTTTSTSASPVFVGLAQANGAFAASAIRASNYFSPAGETASVGDVDADGKLDLISGNQGSGIVTAVFTLSRGDGTFGKVAMQDFF